MPPDPDDRTSVRLAGLRLPPVPGGSGARTTGPGSREPAVPATGGWVPEQPWLDRADRPAASAPPGPVTAPVLDAIADRYPWLRELTTTPSGRALLSLAGVCALCLAMTAWVLLHRPAATAATSYPPVTTTLPPMITPTAAGIIVDVGGRVRHPGLVTLSPGARIADAIEAAGGALRPRDVALVDLAAHVNDGELLLIGVDGAPAGGQGTSGAAADDDAPVNLNTASIDQLDELPGIGPVLAERILDWRTDNGGFHAVEDLDQVSGIGPSLLADLTPLVTV
jgi:competence protein ComEA